ncbi:MAG: TonB-dependent receptor [Acidobacteriota bacterium]
MEKFFTVRSLSRSLVSLAGLLLIAALPILGQQAATSTIEGIVTDPAGAVVPNATVSVHSSQTGFSREINTDQSGIYRLPLLPPGYYSLKIKAGNFAESRAHVVLTVGQKLNFDVQLSISGGVETVTISAEGPIVETTRPSVSSSVNERAVSNLPVNGRNFLDFVTLTPGVVRDARQGDLSFGGQKGTLNSVQIDGVDNNNLFFGQALGRTGSGRAPYQFSQDAVQEFQVNTNTFSAEFGRAAGGAINVITKSGTNDFHGSIFEFYRDRALNANQLRFDATRGVNGAMVPAPVKPPYHFNQFGGFIGGPIKKDRAFFFFNYDGQRSTQPNVVSFGALAPTDADSQRGFALIAPLQASYVRQFNQDVYLAKVDVQITSENRLGFRYNRQNFTGTNLESSGATSALEHTGNSNVRTDSLSITLNTSFTPRLLNEFRVQIAKDREPGFANSDAPEANVNQGGRVVIVFGRNNFSPRETTEDKWQLIDNVTFIKGSHNIKGGFDVNLERILNFFPGQFGGRYFFDSYADFSKGIVSRYAQAFAGLGTQGARSHPDFQEYGFFLQDDWRVKSNLTVNFGVRYDIQKMAKPPVRNPDPRLSAFGVDTSLLNNDYNNIAPRFGFAWNPKEKLVVRGGYGMFYGRTPSIMLGTAHTQNGLSVVLIDLNRPTLPFAYPGRFTDLAQVAAFTPSIPSIFVFDKDFQQPYTQQASFGVEYGLRNDLAVSATYLRVAGTHIQRTRDINLLAPVSYPVLGGFPNLLRHPGVNGTPDRPVTGFSRISQFESTGDSNYNALVLSVNKRYAANFQLSASYTWSKVIDNKPDGTSVVPFNTGDDSKWVQQVFNLNDDRAVGDANVPHRFVASAVWDLAYFRGLNRGARLFVDGWQVSGIIQAASNPPFSALVGSVDINNDGNRFTDRVPGFGRNTFRRDKFVSLDMRLSKTIFITERFKIQLLGELFNAFNRINFSLFNTQLATATVLTSVAGDPTVTTRNPRITLANRTDFGDARAQFDYGLPGSARVGQLAAKFIF